MKKFFLSLVAWLVGECFIGRASLCGAVTIVGGTGYQRGIETAQTGINIESFEVTYSPAVNERLNGITGEPIIRAQSAKFSRAIRMSGEVNAGSGCMAYTLATACAVGNDVAVFGDGSGTILLDSVSEQQSRDGWRSCSFELSSDPLVVAS